MNLFIDAAATAHWQWDRPRTDRSQPHLIRLAACLEDADGNVVDEFSRLIRPLYGWPPIDPDLTLIHHVDDETAKASGRILGAVLGRLTTMTSQATRLIGHSVDFHRRLVARAFADLGIPPPDMVQNAGRSACTMRTATPIVRVPNARARGFKWPTLMEAATHFAGDEPLPERPDDPEEIGQWTVDRVRAIYHAIEAQAAPGQQRGAA